MDMEERALLEDRIDLAKDRIAQIAEETLQNAVYTAYFHSMADFLLMILENRDFINRGGLKSAELSELQERNHALYADVLPQNYERSYANPETAVSLLQEGHGQLLCFLYVELRSLIPFIFERDEEELVIRLELFLEIYGVFFYEWNENKAYPSVESIREILYWFVSDYADLAAEKKIRQLVTTGNGFAAELIQNADLTDIRYLYYYGEYVGENEIQLAKYMAALPEETICTCADTYTEGYRIGFEVTKKDLSKKKIVDVRYRVGFERMVKKALENFRKMGLEPAIYRNATSILYNPSIFKIGFYGGEYNRQYEFDHKDDRALFLDKNYINRRLEVLHTAFEEYKDAARLFAGPAVIETFGEKDFIPKNKKEALKLSEKQQALWVEFKTASGELQRNYIIEEERSFTIIAFPIPEIGDVFETLFDETIRINTLDYQLYRDIQQVLINALDRAEYCHIKGMGENRTDLQVKLYPLKNPDAETKFENCVADVNIPVGEVFTSPVLSGTNGVLHVTKVYLNGLEYRNLEIRFQEGMITEYSCDNFETKEENQAYIRENILFCHETLPMGEFAIGTNTTAYCVAKRLHVADKLPILIAEKMGPHFAVGDTCYSHVEEIRVYNPDGKEIVARENEKSLKRFDNPAAAYFNCHTDITIPYDELGSITAVSEDGTRTVLIENGRFVLPGTEELNLALEEAGRE